MNRKQQKAMFAKIYYARAKDPFDKPKGAGLMIGSKNVSSVKEAKDHFKGIDGLLAIQPSTWKGKKYYAVLYERKN